VFILNNIAQSESPPLTEKVLIPQGTKLDIQYGEDQGSNLIHAFLKITDYSDNFLLAMFNGYESTDRTSFTVQDIQKIILMAIVHPSFSKNSTLILRIVGDTEFSNLEIEESSRVKVPNRKTKKKIDQAEILPLTKKNSSKSQRKQARKKRNKKIKKKKK
jgi:hypothetical protein